LDKTVGAGLIDEGDEIYLIGNDGEELGGSEFIKQYTGAVAGDAPFIDLNEEINLQKVILQSIRNGIIKSAHDCSEGGLAICLAEKSIFSSKKLGAEINLNGNLNYAKLFGESQSRIVVSLSKDKISELEKLCNTHNQKFQKIGKVVKEKFEIKNCFSISVQKITELYEKAIPDLMK
ncbi:MAG: AIR synthase-related protein, partial [FCB group bacterium]